MPRALPAAALVAALLTAGCLGSVEAATIPQDSLPSGWSLQNEDSQSVAMGLASLETREYGTGSGFAGATVATTNDLPILDEEGQVLPRAIEQVEEKKGVRFTNPSELQVQLSNLDQQDTATEYDVEDAGGPAKALIVTPECGSFVIAAGYGTTATGPGGGPSPYDNARSAVKGVVC